MDAKNREKKQNHDIVFLHSPTEDGQGIRALRSRPGRLEAAELRPVKEGENVAFAEVLQLKPREQAPLICDVETIHVPPENAGDASTDLFASERSVRPAQVTSVAYRKNWEAVFGRSKKKPPQGTLLN